MESTSPYHKTEIALDESVSLSDLYKLPGTGFVYLYEWIIVSDKNQITEQIIPRIISEEIDLLALEEIFEEIIIIPDAIPAELDSLSISTWIYPDFDIGSPQYTIASKENSFELYVTNILEPQHTAGFSIFDGITWSTISGDIVLEEKWHHIVGTIEGPTIKLYVDGVFDGHTNLEQYNMSDNGQFYLDESKISLNDSDIIIYSQILSDILRFCQMYSDSLRFSLKKSSRRAKRAGEKWKSRFP